MRVTHITNPDSPCNGMYCADGDGGDEELRDIDMVVGSPFADPIDSNGRDVQRGLGADVIDGVQVGTPTPTSTVYVDAVSNRPDQLIDVGVVVLGSPGNDHYQVARQRQRRDDRNADAALTAVAPCVNVDAMTVRCDRRHVVNSSRIAATRSTTCSAGSTPATTRSPSTARFRATSKLHASGGPGNDHLVGGDEQDIFSPAPTATITSKAWAATTR